MSAGALDLQQILQRLRASEWVDLTHSFAPGVPHYHQFPDEQREQLFDYPDGFRVHEYRHVGQWGTHVDPPSHFIEGGRTLDQLPVTDMVLELVVLDARSRVEADPDYAADAELVAAHEAEHGPVPEGAFVALRTGWSARWPDPEAFDNGGRRPGWDVSRPGGPGRPARHRRDRPRDHRHRPGGGAGRGQHGGRDLHPGPRPVADRGHGLAGARCPPAAR